MTIATGVKPTTANLEQGLNWLESVVHKCYETAVGSDSPPRVFHLSGLRAAEIHCPPTYQLKPTTNRLSIAVSFPRIETLRRTVVKYKATVGKVSSVTSDLHTVKTS
jgi:hypothetical protein